MKINQIDMLPRGDEVEIETWFQAEGRIAACRNWLIRDKASGQQLGQGTRCVARPLSHVHVVLRLAAPGQGFWPAARAGRRVCEPAVRGCTWFGAWSLRFGILGPTLITSCHGNTLIMYTVISL